MEGFYETSEDDLFAYMVGIRGDLKILFEGNFRNHKRHGKKCKLYHFGIQKKVLKKSPCSKNILGD